MAIFPILWLKMGVRTLANVFPNAIRKPAILTEAGALLTGIAHKPMVFTAVGEAPGAIATHVAQLVKNQNYQKHHQRKGPQKDAEPIIIFLLKIKI
jgi:hypothetical protein